MSTPAPKYREKAQVLDDAALGLLALDLLAKWKEPPEGRTG